ncbi:MAG: hypothetical protein M0Z38_08460 [Deltaproteobacteria bacterium]|nr:hypothetical protein [Deltaproteobacteria bacterium]
MGRYSRDYFDSVTIVAGDSATIWSKRWIGMEGYAFALGAEVGDRSLWALVEFNVLINGVPVLDYGKIRDLIATADLMTAVEIYIPPYALIEMVATNGSGSDAVFIGRLKCKEGKME